VLLHFGAVDYAAQVWVNGQLVAEHEGGHTPFHADVTDALTAGEQVVVVRAEDHPTDPEQPRGKQDWQPEPHVIWYHRTTGIWQPVWLETVPARHIEAVRWTTLPSKGRIELDVDLAGGDDPAELTVEVRDLARQTITVRGAHARMVLDIPALHHGQDLDRLLWTPEHPVLLDTELTLTAGSATDTVAGYVGLREVGVRDGRFTLNGHPYFLRMVLEQGYWPDSHLAAPGDDALRREVELIKSLGFNGARLHQKVEDPRFLYHCDRLGLLVWDEMPSAYAFSARTVDRICREASVCGGVGADQRELGRAAHRHRTGAAEPGVGALPPHQGAGPDPAGDLQRRLGTHHERHLRPARLFSLGRRAHRQVPGCGGGGRGARRSRPAGPQTVAGQA
jgi:beta-galactosidase/beta-glucuronidase